MMLKNFIRKYSISRITRLYLRLTPYIDFIEKKCSNKVKKSMNDEIQEFDKIKKKILTFTILRSLLYLSLSAATISAIFGSNYLLQKTLSWLVVFSGVIGTVFIMGLISLSNRLINIYTGDAQMIFSIVTATAIKHGYDK